MSDGVCAHGLWLKLVVTVSDNSWDCLTVPFQNWNGCLSHQSWASCSLFVLRHTELFRQIRIDCLAHCLNRIEYNY